MQKTVNFLRECRWSLQLDAVSTGAAENLPGSRKKQGQARDQQIKRFLFFLRNSLIQGLLDTGRMNGDVFIAFMLSLLAQFSPWCLQLAAAWRCATFAVFLCCWICPADKQPLFTGYQGRVTLKALRSRCSICRYCLDKGVVFFKHFLLLLNRSADNYSQFLCLSLYR